MARIVAFIPDLLFGSNVVGALQAAGHEPVLVSDPYAVRGELQGIPGTIKTLAFYSHVEADVRAQAERAGFDLVVPRSRMAREGASLVDRLVES